MLGVGQEKRSGYVRGKRRELGMIGVRLENGCDRG